MNDIDGYLAELQRLLGTSSAAQSVIREAHSHLDEKVAALVASGVAPAQAQAEAVAAFGDAREFAVAALAGGSLDAAPPTALRWIMLAGTVLTGAVAAFALVAIVATALFGGEGESGLGFVLIGGVAATVLAHAVAQILLLRRWRAGSRLFRGAVFFGGIALIAVGGGVMVFSAFDDAPGGVLAGMLLVAQGGAALLTVAYPQLVPTRVLRA